MGFRTSKCDIFRDLEILDVEIDKHSFWRFLFCDKCVVHTCRKCFTRTGHSSGVFVER